MNKIKFLFSLAISAIILNTIPSFYHQQYIADGVFFDNQVTSLSWRYTKEDAWHIRAEFDDFEAKFYFKEKPECPLGLSLTKENIPFLATFTDKSDEKSSSTNFTSYIQDLDGSISFTAEFLNDLKFRDREFEYIIVIINEKQNKCKASYVLIEEEEEKSPNLSIKKS